MVFRFRRSFYRRWIGTALFVLLFAALLLLLQTSVQRVVAQRFTAQRFAELRYGDTVEGEISERQPEVYFTFFGRAGDTVVITMLDISDSFDPYLILQTSNGRELASDDDSAGNLDAQISLTLPADDTYVIVATRFSGSGQFLLVLEGAPGSRQGGGGGASGGELGYGDSVEGSISDRQPEVYFNFNASRGDQVVITLLDTSDTFDPYLILLASDGREIARDDDSAGDLNAQISVRLPDDDVYTIVATRFDGSGDFLLILENEQGSGGGGGGGTRSGSNCAVTSYHLVGQARGSIVRKRIPGWSGFPQPAMPARQDGEPTAVIVIDDFTTGIELARTHGDYVSDLMAEVVPGFVDIETIDLFDAGFDTREIARQTGERIVELVDVGYTRIVLNMSFGLVPCYLDEYSFSVQDFAIDYPEYGDALLEIIPASTLFNTLPRDARDDGGLERSYAAFEQIRQRFAANGDPWEVTTVLADEFELDYLQLLAPVYTAYTQMIWGSGAVVTVAAAGNHRQELGDGYPLAPARFPGIIAVSAYDEDRGDLFDWSQDGEMTIYGGPFDFGQDELSGTSFAAPLVAAMIIQEGAFCTFEPINNPNRFNNAGFLQCG